MDSPNRVDISDENTNSPKPTNAPPKIGTQMLFPLILPNDITSDVHIATLPHPKTKVLSPFLFPTTSSTILEVQEMAPEDEQESSWIIDDDITSTGKLLVASPIDPLLILLPIFETARGKSSEYKGLYKKLGDISSDENIQWLLTRAHSFISNICDTIDLVDEETVYRLNDEKVLCWLKAKVELLSIGILKEMPHLLEKGSFSGFSNTKEETMEEKERKAKEHSIWFLFEFLEQHWIDRLTTEYGFGQFRNIPKETIFDDSGHKQSAANNRNATKPTRGKVRAGPIGQRGKSKKKKLEAPKGNAVLSSYWQKK